MCGICVEVRSRDVDMHDVLRAVASARRSKYFTDSMGGVETINSDAMDVFMSVATGRDMWATSPPNALPKCCALRVLPHSLAPFGTRPCGERAQFQGASPFGSRPDRVDHPSGGAARSARSSQTHFPCCASLPFVRMYPSSSSPPSSARIIRCPRTVMRPADAKALVTSATWKVAMLLP